MSHRLPIMVKARFIPTTAMAAWLFLGTAGCGETQPSIAVQAPQTTSGAVAGIGVMETSTRTRSQLAPTANGSFVSGNATLTNAGVNPEGRDPSSTGRMLGAQATSSAGEGVMIEGVLAIAQRQERVVIGHRAEEDRNQFPT